MKNAFARPFNVRAFVAWTVTVSGAGLPVTGYANHLFQFSAMNFERRAWMTAHNTLALVFGVFAVWHVVLNRRVLVKYARGFSRRIPGISREAVLAVAAVILFVSLCVGHAFLLK